MWEKLRQIWVAKDIRNKILYTVGLLIVFRVMAHIPVPGVNAANLEDFFNNNQIFGLLNIFSGGGLQQLSIAMLGVAPYITSSIIFQLLTMIIPKLEELSKEGDEGRKKINQYTRLLTVPLALMQGYGLISILSSSQNPVLTNVDPFSLVTILVAVTAGTILIMWLGELITENGIGNGISIIIFVGIVSAVPQAVQQSIATWDPSKLPGILVFLVMAIVVIGGVVIVTEGQRNIPVSYAKRIRGNRMYGGVSTHLPLRVNTAGVIPIIFAISLLLLPGVVANFFVQSTSPTVARIAQTIVDLFQNNFFYGLTYFILVVLFTYFYTAVIFHPDTIAENLQKQGGFIPGIRPGKNTAQYLNKVINRITLTGALFLGLIAVMPVIAQAVTGIGTLVLGGTGLLIVVSVVLETMKQVESQLVMRDYEGFL